MNSRQSIVAVLTMTTLLASPGRMPARSEAEEPGTTYAVADCTFELASVRKNEPRLRWRELSEQTELVATATAPSRSRTPRSSTGPVIPRVNFVDDEIFSTMDKASVKPTTLASDSEFLRRVTLDLTGEIPTSEVVRSFLGDWSTNKRQTYVTGLLASEGFVDRWTMWFGDLVQNAQATTNTREYYLGRNQYYSWIREQIRTGVPYDRMVREVIAGRGMNFTAGPPNYIVRGQQPNGPVQDSYDNLAAHSAQRFLGIPFECLSCHGGARHLELVNIDLSTKTRDDFWKMAAFFSRTTARGFTDTTYPNFRQYDVTDNMTGSYRLNTTTGNKSPRAPATGQPAVVEPQFLSTGERAATGEDLRVAFGRMLTANRQFARTTVNQLWKELFHLGLVEPVDGFDLARLTTATLPAGVSLQPTHPALLEKLTDEFIRSGYDLRHILKVMTTSNAYQLSTFYTPGAWSEVWTPYFARHYASRMQSEALLDAIVRSTNVPVSINVQGSTAVTKAMKLPDPTEPNSGNATGRFLNAFNRGDRDETPRTSEGSILQALNMMNDPFLVTRTRQATAGSAVGNILRTSTDPAVIADTLYIATLSRNPTVAERDEAVAYLRGGTLARRTEDLHFTLLNRIEFLFH